MLIIKTQAFESTANATAFESTEPFEPSEFSLYTNKAGNDEDDRGSLFDRFKELFSSEIIDQSSQDGRLFVINMAINAFVRRPFLGHGLGTFGSSASFSWNSPLNTLLGLNRAFYADNQYAPLLVETGIFGFALFYLFAISAIYIPKKQIMPNNNADNNRNVSMAKLLSAKKHLRRIIILAMLWLSLFFPFFEFRSLTILFWLLVSSQIQNDNLRISGQDDKINLRSKKDRTYYTMFNKIEHATKKEVIDEIISTIKSGSSLHVITANPETFRYSLKRNVVKAILNSDSSMFVADGIGVVYASKILNIDIPERVTGIDLMSNLLTCASMDGNSAFFFGSSSEVIEMLRSRIRNHYSGINVVGMEHGYQDRDSIKEMIVRAQPDYLFVALGIPEQEEFIYRVLPSLDNCIAIGVGGSFDVLSGLKREHQKYLLILSWSGYIEL